MTLSRRKSRIIDIDGIKFRWAISPDSGYVVYVAEKEGVKGRKIEVYINSDANSFWIEFPNVQDLDMKIIKPKDSESIICQAIKLGWNPEEKGRPIKFDLIGAELIKRK